MAQQTRKWLRAGMLVALAAVAARPASAQTRASAQPSGTSSAVQNMNIFIGLDGSKQPQDLGINANMGTRFGVNFGFPIMKENGLGGQVGAALNLSDAAVHVLDQVGTTSSRMQLFVTAGVFQKDFRKFTWAAGIDLQYSDYYDTFWLGQVRAQVGRALNNRHEVGAWFTVGMMGADADVDNTGIGVRLEPIGQINGYWSQTWPAGGRTALWVGLASGHDNVVAAFPPEMWEPRSDWVAVYGAALQLPLSDRFAIAGAANFLTPTATGTVDAYLCVVFSPGGSKGGGTFRPVMPVGNNPMMPINLKVR